jgi:hypothetical protein
MSLEDATKWLAPVVRSLTVSPTARSLKSGLASSVKK